MTKQQAVNILTSTVTNLEKHSDPIFYRDMYIFPCKLKNDDFAIFYAIDIAGNVKIFNIGMDDGGFIDTAKKQYVARGGIL